MILKRPLSRQRLREVLGHKEITVTHLRKLMLDELQRRNYAQNTVRAYIRVIEDFAKYFRRSPDRLGPEHIHNPHSRIEIPYTHRIRRKR